MRDWSPGLRLGAQHVEGRSPGGVEPDRDRQPPDRRPGLLGPAGPAVGVPERGATDAQCNAPTTYEYQYKSSVTGRSQPTTRRTRRPTSRRRRPTGRDGAVHRPHRDRLPGPRPVPDRRPLPARPGVDRVGPQPQFNHKLLITHGASCGIEHQSGTPRASPATRRRARRAATAARPRRSASASP